jgi:hypothetical protein
MNTITRTSLGLGATDTPNFTGVRLSTAAAPTEGDFQLTTSGGNCVLQYYHSGGWVTKATFVP